MIVRNVVKKWQFSLELKWINLINKMLLKNLKVVITFLTFILVSRGKVKKLVLILLKPIIIFLDQKTVKSEFIYETIILNTCQKQADFMEYLSKCFSKKSVKTSPKLYKPVQLNEPEKRSANKFVKKV